MHYDAFRTKYLFYIFSCIVRCRWFRRRLEAVIGTRYRRKMGIGILAHGSLIYDPRREIKIVVETIDRNIENK